MNGEDIKRNKILIITYVFPPAAYVGVYRTLKYCKYLREQGWDPLVLTIRPAGITYRNEALSREIPSDVPVYRTFNIDPANWLEKRSRRKGKACPKEPVGLNAAMRNREIDLFGQPRTDRASCREVERNYA